MNEAEVSLKKLLEELWSKRLFLSSITSISAIISIVVALNLPNIYTSTSIVAPSLNENTISNNLGGYSSIAGLAGINLPAKNINKSDEAIARIQSYDFFVDEFIPNIKFEDLVAYKKWNKQQDKIIYDEDVFLQNKWVRKVNGDKGIKPSNQEAFKIYKKILTIDDDQQSSFVTIEITHVSPNIAKEWLELIINKINDYMRDIDKEIAENSINFLQNTYLETNISQLKNVISTLIENHVQTLTLAESNIDYVFKPISSPIAPEEKSGPLRALICIFGTLLGLIIGIFYVFFFNIIIRN